MKEIDYLSSIAKQANELNAQFSRAIEESRAYEGSIKELAMRTKALQDGVSVALNSARKQASLHAEFVKILNTQSVALADSLRSRY